VYSLLNIFSIVLGNHSSIFSQHYFNRNIGKNIGIGVSFIAYLAFLFEHTGDDWLLQNNKMLGYPKFWKHNIDMIYI